MKEIEDLRSALQELDHVRKREATALQDSHAAFAVLDGMVGVTDLEQALTMVLQAVQHHIYAAQVILCRAPPEGGAVQFLRQLGGPPLTDGGVMVQAGFMSRPRRMIDLSILAPGHGLTPMQSGILAPLPVPHDPGLAILCLSDRKNAFLHSDLNRLAQMARVAAQPLTALQLTRRNADLAALIDRRPRVEDGSDDVLDQPFRAVNRAVDRLTQAQGLVVSILNRLLTATDTELDQVIHESLAQMGQHCDIDRVYVFEITRPGRADNTFEWVSDGTAPMIDALQDLPIDSFPNWLAVLEQGKDIYIPDIKDLPDDYEEKSFMQGQGIQSLVMSPLIDHDVLEGLIGYDMVRRTHGFLQGEIFLLRSVANAIGAMLRKRRSTARNLAAQRALDLERARLKATLGALPDLVIELDPHGRFCEHYSHGNEDMVRIAGELIDRTMRESVPPAVADAGHRMLEEVAQTGRTDGHTFQYDIGNGDLRWIRANAARREPANQGEQPGYLFVLRDVSREVEQAREIDLLSQMAKSTSNLVTVTDPQGRLTWVNDAFERVSGWTKEEVLGRRPWDFLQPPEDGRSIFETVRTSLTGGLPMKEDVKNISKDGRIYWVSLDVQPLRDADGTLTGFMTIQTDITEAKTQAAALAKAADAARQAQERLIAAVESLEDGFVYFDKDGKLVVCNERYRTITPGFADILVPGVTLEQIFRRGLTLGIYEDAIGREEEWLQHRLSEHRKSELTIEQRLSDGRWIRIFDKTTPDGGRVGLRVDITALKEAEAKALSDRAAALDAAHEGMAITAPDGRFLYANQAFAMLLGQRKAAALLGHGWAQYLGPDVQADLEARALCNMHDAGDSWRGVLEWLPDGAKVKTDLEVSLSRRGDGAMVWVLRDLSERRAAERESSLLREELQTAQRREVIGQLAAGLAHDFNNLIAAISGSATLILEDDAPGAIERAQSHALRIQKSAERAEAMVRRLLALGARPTSHRQTDLGPVLREAADLLRPGLGQSVRLLVDVTSDPMTTTLEPTDVLQIVLNLGINARDAMLHAPAPRSDNQIRLALRPATAADLAGPASGNLRLGTPDPDRAHACLTVADNGPGIPPGQAERIFAPYFSTKGAKGSGLGLSIVAGVVKAAGGCISLSQAPGGGAVFTILLPLDAGGQPDAKDLSVLQHKPLLAVLEPMRGLPASANPMRPPVMPDAPGLAPAVGISADARTVTKREQPLQGRSILIVDDQEDVLVVLAHLLERAGAEVAPTSDPEAALEVLREDPDAFDLVITDYDMGHLTGADLSRVAHQARPDIPVILVTALPDWRLRDDKSKGDPSFYGVLGKPVSAEALVASAVSAIDSRHN